jgi:hypothetical protein
MACFGTGGTNARNRRLTSDGLRLPSHAIPRIGRTVTLTWPQNHASASLTRVSPTLAVISTGGVEVEIVLRQWPMPVVRGRQRGIRTRFACPRCEASRDALHFVDGSWCCRGASCGNLAFASRHRQRYCTSIARRERLRRALIRATPGSLRARELREKIKREERMVVAHMRRVSDDLTKRSERDGRHRRATERT